MGKNSELADGSLEYANQEYNKIFGNLQTFYGEARNTINQGRQDFYNTSKPYLDSSLSSMGELERFLGLADSKTGAPALTGEQVTQKLEATPGYKFQVNQGNQALQRTAAAGGMLSSGNALLAAQQFGQGLAQTTYQSHLTNLLNLNATTQPVVAANLANIQNSSQVNAQLYANQANQIQQAYTQKGNTNAAAAMQTSAQNAQAANNSQVSAGAMAGLQAGYLRGAF